MEEGGFIEDIEESGEKSLCQGLLLCRDLNVTQKQNQVLAEKRSYSTYVFQ